MRLNNFLVKKSKAGVIQRTKWSSDYSKESIGFVYAHINIVPKGQLSVKDNTQIYFFGAQRIGVLLVFELLFLGNNQQSLLHAVDLVIDITLHLCRMKLRSQLADQLCKQSRSYCRMVVSS